MTWQARLKDTLLRPIEETLRVELAPPQQAARQGVGAPRAVEEEQETRDY